MRMTGLLVLFGLAGCAVPPASPCAGMPGDPSVTVQLLFGRSIKGGGEVDAAQWRAFLATSVTPRFPDGLTVLEGTGQWRQRATGRVVSENSTVVEIVTTAAPDTWTKLDAVRADYKARFAQESVGLVVNPSCASW
jgi:hypothetical protein